MIWQKMKKNTSMKFTDDLSVTFQLSVCGASEFGLKEHSPTKNAAKRAMKHHDVSAARQKTSGAAAGFVILSCHLSEELSSQSEFPHLFPTSRPSCLKNEGNDALALH